MSNRQGFNACRHIAKLVREALYPFNPGDVVVTVTDNFGESMTAIVDISLYSDSPFILERDPEIFHLGDVYFVATLIGIRAGKHYRSIPALPINDNIVLSEN